MPGSTTSVASLKRIAPLTPTLQSAGPSSTLDVATPASSGSSAKLTPPPAETPGSGSFRRARRPSCSSDAALSGSSTLALPEDHLLVEERRKHARTRELLETQTSQLAAREREILLLRAELKEAKARPDRRRAHNQPPPPPPPKLTPVRWSWSVSLWPWLGSHQPRALASAEQLQADETGVATSCVDEDGNSSDDEGGEGGEGLASPASHVSDSVADDAGGGAPAGSSLLEGGGGGGRRAAAQRTAPPGYLDTRATVRFRQRIPWLLGLMQVQSISSLVLDRYTDILEHHLNVSAFLTMALGTGGNVGGQAVAEIIKALRAGEVRRADFGRLVREEMLAGLMLGLSLFCAAFVRVLAFGQCDLMEACTVALACFCLVSFTSVLAPLVTLGLSLCRMETAGAPPTITVLVDLVGTFLVCQLVRLLLHSRMVDHDDMSKGYVWTVSSELEQLEEWEHSLLS